MWCRKLAELRALMEPGGRQGWHWGRWDRHSHSGRHPMTPGQVGKAQGEAWVPSRKESRAKEQLSPGATSVWPAEAALPDHSWELSKDNQLFIDQPMGGIWTLSSSSSPGDLGGMASRGSVPEGDHFQAGHFSANGDLQRKRK